MSALEAHELESQLERDRAALSQSLEELGQLARERADPREHVRNRPLAWLAGALVVGFWWGSSR
jgi:hypothetical protein